MQLKQFTKDPHAADVQGIICLQPSTAQHSTHQQSDPHTLFLTRQLRSKTIVAISQGVNALSHNTSDQNWANDARRIGPT